MRHNQVNSKSEAWIEGELDALRGDHLLRSLSSWPGSGGHFDAGEVSLLNFASNDYLDLAHHPLTIAAARDAASTWGTGATASRLVTGTLTLHEELESQLAAHKGYPAALLFGSGYLANAGLIAALASDGDAIIADKLIHASILDAAKLSGARLFRFQHNDVDHLRAVTLRAGKFRRLLVVTESVFSMDGDLAPLREIADVAQEIGALLIVDEAHATGVFGPHGSGRVRELHLEHAVNVSMFTLSKALGGYGGGVACSRLLRDWFINKARSFIYTTALPPPVVAAASAAVSLLGEHPDWGRELLGRAAFLRAELQARGLDTLDSASQIVPVLVGDNAKTLRVASRLRAEGILVAAIRPPTVPPGTARLRLSLTLAHGERDLRRAAEAIGKAMS